MDGIFVTGTDTGVGKTAVSAALLSFFRANGSSAAPMKPVQTGCRKRGGRLCAPDLDFCLSAIGLRASPGERSLMSRYRFEPACSPHLAARRSGKRISIARIVSDFRQLALKRDFVIVEGAGGVLVPLSDDCTMLDLMTALSLPVVLVSRPGLGTINHTLLSLRELRRAGLNVLGIVFNESRKHKPGFIEEDNVHTISAIGRVPVIARLPFAPNLRRLAGSPDAFHRWCSANARVTFAY